MNHFNHRSVKPYSILNIVFNAASFTNFADNTRSVNVACFKRMNVNFAVFIDKFCTKRAHFFCYKFTKNLSRVSSSSRVILQRILIQKFCTGTVSHNKTVSCCTIMVRSRESLIVHSSCTTSCNNYYFCFCNANFVCFHINKNSTASFTFVIFDDFNCRSKINYSDIVLSVESFIAQSTHDFCSRIVFAGMHTFAASSATMSCYHSSVSFLVKFNTKVIEPFDYRRSFVYKRIYKFWFSVKVTATITVKIVLGW